MNPVRFSPLDFAAISAMFGEWLAGNTAARIEGVPDSESLDELNARVLPGYAEIIARHADEDGVIAIVGHGGSIGWTMPSFAENISLTYAIQNGLHNTGIVEVQLHDGSPYVTNWQGTPVAWPGQPATVPLPATSFLLMSAFVGALGLRARTGRRAAV